MKLEDKKPNSFRRFSKDSSKKIELTSLNSNRLSIPKMSYQEKIEKYKEQKKTELVTNTKMLTDYHYEILINELKKPIIKTPNLRKESHVDIEKIKVQETNTKKNRNIKIISLILKLYIKLQQYAKLNCLGEEFIKVLSYFGTYQHFEKGTPIYKLHSKSNFFYFVIKGRVSIKSIDPEKIKEEMDLKENENKTMNKEVESDDEEKLQEFFDNYNYENNDNISLKNLIIDSGNENKNKIFNEVDFDINNDFTKMEKQKKNINMTNKNLQSTRRSTIFERIKKKLNHTMDVEESKKNNINLQIFNKNLLELQKNLSCELQIVQKGKFFGEWDLILNRPHSNCAFADEDTDLLLLNKIYFHKFLKKRLSKADLDRKYFIMKRIPLLQIEHLVYIHPEFFDKNTIVYTQYNTADEFFIILQGSGALIKLNNCKSKQDILYNKNEIETMCIIDSGGIVGLEAGKEKIGKYEYNFIITEENTVLYRIPLSKNKSKFSPQFRDELKEFLMSLYKKQFKFLEKRKKKVENYKRKRKMEKTNEDKKCENAYNFVKNENLNLLNQVKCTNTINLKTQIFNFFPDNVKNKYLLNSKLSRMKLLREYYCHSNKIIKIKKPKQKENKIFLTNVKNKEKDNIQKNVNSFDDDYYNAKNIFILTPSKKELNQKYIKTEKRLQINSAGYKKKEEEKRLIKTPHVQSCYKLIGSPKSSSRFDKDTKNSPFLSSLSKMTTDTGNNSNINMKNLIINNNKFNINKTSYYLINKLKTKNLENKMHVTSTITGNSDENRISYNTENFNVTVFKRKINTNSQ